MKAHKKIVQRLSYTEYHVNQRINNKDGYKDITDGIEYNIFSFRSPEAGLHIYLTRLQQRAEVWIECLKEKGSVL